LHTYASIADEKLLLYTVLGVYKHFHTVTLKKLTRHRKDSA